MYVILARISACNGIGREASALELVEGETEFMRLEDSYPSDSFSFQRVGNRVRTP